MTEVITHIVLFKYKPDIAWSDFEKHFDVFMSLKSKCVKPDTEQPYMKSMKAGKLWTIWREKPALTVNRQKPQLGRIQQGIDAWLCTGVREPGGPGLLSDRGSGAFGVLAQCSAVDVGTRLTCERFALTWYSDDSVVIGTVAQSTMLIYLLTV